MSMTDSRPHGRSGPVAGPGVGRHLLIVDDDDRIRELLKEFLAREGYRVTGAAHAAAARRLMELIEFDLVVLDIMMPGESGLDLTSWVRSKAELSRTPVLLLTARGDANDRIEGLSRGADDYMSKPFEPRELALHVPRAEEDGVQRAVEDARAPRRAPEEGPEAVLDGVVVHARGGGWQGRETTTCLRRPRARLR